MDRTQIEQQLQAAAALELRRRLEEERLRYYQRPLIHFKQREVHQTPKRFRGVLGGNRCLVAGSEVWMADGTVKPIEEVQVGDWVMGFDRKKRATLPVRVVWSGRTGEKPCARLAFRGGQHLECSVDHPLLSTTRGGDGYIWRLAAEYPLGKHSNHVAHVADLNVTEVDPGFSPEFARLLGYLIGDGSFIGDTVRFTNTNSEIVEDFISLVPEGMHVRQHGASDYFASVPNGVKGGNVLILMLREWGLWGSKASEKFVPPPLLRAPQRHVAEFLRGLIAADGYVSDRGVGFTTTSERLAKEVYRLFVRLGAVPHISQRNLGPEQHSIQHEVRIRHQEMLQRLSQHITDIPGKGAIKPVRRTTKSRLIRSNVYPVFVEKVEDLGVLPIYDVTVDHPDHAFVVNGVIVHNTGKTISGAVETVLFALGKHAEPYVQSWYEEDQKWWYERFADMNVSKRESIWAATENWDVHRDVTQPVLLQWLPQTEIEDVAWRKKGVIDFITLSQGRRIVFKSYETGPKGFMGASLPFVWLDEEPPLDIWNECEKRVMDVKGSILLTFTPLSGLTWSHGRIYLNENNDPETWSTHFTWDDNPYLDDQEKERLLSQMTSEEAEARVHGRYLVFGQGVFDSLVLMDYRKSLHRGKETPIPHRHRSKDIKDLDIPVEVWELPEPGERYVIGADVAEGLPSGDNHAACVLRARDGTQVAELVTRDVDASVFGELLMALGYWYNIALIQPERNNDGKVVIAKLLDSNYPNIYRHYDDDRWGMPTSVKTRPELVALGQEMVRDAVETIRSPVLVEEMLTFVRDARGRPQAAGKGTRGGKKDDRIFAWLHSLWARQWSGDIGLPVRPRTPLAPVGKGDQMDQWVAGHLDRDEDLGGSFARWSPRTFTRWPSR